MWEKTTKNLSLCSSTIINLQFTIVQLDRNLPVANEYTNPLRNQHVVDNEDKNPLKNETITYNEDNNPLRHHPEFSLKMFLKNCNFIYIYAIVSLNNYRSFFFSFHPCKNRIESILIYSVFFLSSPFCMWTCNNYIADKV
jgi:hypothetical protein